MKSKIIIYQQNSLPNSLIDNLARKIRTEPIPSKENKEKTNYICYIHNVNWNLSAIYGLVLQHARKCMLNKEKEQVEFAVISLLDKGQRIQIATSLFNDAVYEPKATNYSVFLHSHTDSYVQVPSLPDIIQQEESPQRLLGVRRGLITSTGNIIPYYYTPLVKVAGIEGQLREMKAASNKQDKFNSFLELYMASKTISFKYDTDLKSYLDARNALSCALANNIALAIQTAAAQQRLKDSPDLGSLIDNPITILPPIDNKNPKLSDDMTTAINSLGQEQKPILKVYIADINQKATTQNDSVMIGFTGEILSRFFPD